MSSKGINPRWMSEARAFSFCLNGYPIGGSLPAVRIGLTQTHQASKNVKEAIYPLVFFLSPPYNPLKIR